MLSNNKEIIERLNEYKIANYKINENLSVDVYGGVFLSKTDIYKFDINFNIVDGDFIANECKLIDLIGSPLVVTGDYSVRGNSLTSLIGSPMKIGGAFNCSQNQITTLRGGPVEVGEDYICYSNKLETLDGFPESIRGVLDCRPYLPKSLDECPRNIGNLRSDTFTNEQYQRFVRAERLKKELDRQLIGSITKTKVKKV